MTPGIAGRLITRHSSPVTDSRERGALAWWYLEMVVARVDRRTA